MRASLQAALNAWTASAKSLTQGRAGIDGTSLEWCDSLASMSAQEVYKEFGRFWSDRAKDYVADLAKYQLDVWDDLEEFRFCVYLKAQKLGFTTFCHMYTIWRALTRDRGNSMYIVSQDMTISKMHLDALKNYMRNSPALLPYLVERPPRDETGRLLRGAASKSTVAVIANPERPSRPTRIFAKAIVAGSSLISHANVSHIHMSDISAARMTEEDMENSFGRAVTRLLNTRGSMVIESPPSLYPNGLMTRIGWDVLDWAQKGGLRLDADGEFLKDGTAYRHPDWLLRRLHYDVGVRDGTLTKAEVNLQRRKMAKLSFDQLMEASLKTGEGKAFEDWMTAETSDDVADIGDRLYEWAGWGK